MRNDAELFVEEAVPVDDRITVPRGVESIEGHTADGARFLLAYDASGHRTAHRELDAGGKVAHEWQYDPGGLLLRELAFDPAGGVRSTLDVLYDAGLWREKRMHYAPDVLSYRIVAERDGDGRLERAVFVDPGGATLRSDRYVFEGGRLMRVDSGPMGPCTYEYDARGSLQRKSVDRPGASAHGEVYEFEYDPGGLLTAMHHLHVRSLSFRHRFFES